MTSDQPNEPIDGASSGPSADAPVSAKPDLSNTMAIRTGEPVDLGEPADQGLADDSALDALAAGTALLVVSRGPNAGSRFLLDADTVTVGRHPDSDIFLDDITVSRRHAEFRRGDAGFTVDDVGSLNGTYVNRDRVDHAVLAGGDEVQIGKYRLVFHPAAQES
jgi:pSer/pThr/pTyr-binding forkhead associated (FHA) protein